MIDKNRAQQRNSGTNQSNWNSQGTWEEKNYDIEKVKVFLKEEIVGKIVGAFLVTDVTNMTGKMSVVTARGKKKLGYEFAMKIAIKQIKTSAQAVLNIKEITDWDPEPEVFICQLKDNQVSIEDKGFSSLKKAVMAEMDSFVELVRGSLKQYK